MSETAFVTTSLPPVMSVPETAADDTAGDKKKKKKGKVRSAWISFIGRILAQMFGAVATVVLGLQLVRGYFPPTPVEAASAATAAAAPAVGVWRPGGMKVMAVLPVTNYSGDRRHDAFSDGLTDTLIAELARTPGIHVTSRTSSMHFRDKTELLPSIARQLGVSYVLESSLVTADGRRRLTVQLIDAATDLHVWVQQYDLSGRDVLDVHSTIARVVARDVRTAGIGLEE